jgi:hypothetical protein
LVEDWCLYENKSATWLPVHYYYSEFQVTLGPVSVHPNSLTSEVHYLEGLRGSSRRDSPYLGACLRGSLGGPGLRGLLGGLAWEGNLEERVLEGPGPRGLLGRPGLRVTWRAWPERVAWPDSYLEGLARPRGLLGGPGQRGLLGGPGPRGLLGGRARPEWEFTHAGLITHDRPATITRQGCLHHATQGCLHHATQGCLHPATHLRVSYRFLEGGWRGMLSHTHFQTL